MLSKTNPHGGPVVTSTGTTKTKHTCTRLKTKQVQYYNRTSEFVVNQNYKLNTYYMELEQFGSELTFLNAKSPTLQNGTLQ